MSHDVTIRHCIDCKPHHQPAQAAGRQYYPVGPFGPEIYDQKYTVYSDTVYAVITVFTVGIAAASLYSVLCTVAVSSAYFRELTVDNTFRCDKKAGIKLISSNA